MGNAYPDPQGPQTAHGGKMLFWYLRFFGTMGFCASATGTLWYQLINKLYPIQISPYGGVYRPYNEWAVIWGISTLLILAPVFYVFATILRRAIKERQVELNRGVRQWLGYTFLFIVVTVVISDLIAAMYFFLNGDYSTRFFLKVSTVFLISGWLFSYTWLELRSPDSLVTSRLPRTMGIASGIVMALSVGIGFTLIDSPALARAKAFDAQRAYDVRELQRSAQNFYNKHQRIPDSLEMLHEEGMIRKFTMVDPDTGEPYEFQVIDEQHYEICATFNTNNRDDEEEGYEPRNAYGSAYLHGAERTCFEETIRETPEHLMPANR